MPTGRWLDYQQQFEQFHDWWKKPLPTPRGSGLARNLALSIFVIVLVGLFCGGALFSGVFLFSALKHDAPSSLKWMATHMMLPFLCVWWLGLLFFARRIWRVRRAFSGGMTPAKLAVRPVMQTRFKMQLPDGQVVTGHAEVNYASRLDSGEAHPTDLAIYDPARPRDALLLSSFLPAFSVSPAGHWDQDPEKARDFFTALWAAAEREPRPPVEPPKANVRISRGTAEGGTAAQAEQAAHSHRRRPAKAHVRGDDRSTLGRRRKDFWLSPAGKRLERIGWWAIKVYACVFGLLLGGLLGAYFGGFAIRVLRSFGSGAHVDLVKARQWGWVVGAVAAAAIGAANIWDRRRKRQNGKDAFQGVLSAPTRSRVRRHALAAEECEEDSSGSFLHRILFTVVGAVLGMAVAAKLVLIWFSIAVSPELLT